MTVSLLGVPYPIHLVGESHTLVFRNLLVRDDDSGRLYQTKIRYLPHVLAQNFFYQASQSHNVDLIDALRFEGLLRADLQPAHSSLDGATVSGAWMEKRSIVAPALVFCIGDLDLHHLLDQFGDYDFELPGDECYGADHTRPPVPHGTVLAQLEKLLAPFGVGLRQLKGAGFSRMMVHCIPPRSADDSTASRWMSAPKAVRAKMTVMANRILARLCAEADIPFIDTWTELTRDGYLLPEYDIDGMHLSREAALLSLQKIIACMTEVTWNTQNLPRYRHAVDTALRYATPEPQAGTVRPAAGLSVGLFDTGAVLPLAAAREDYAATPRNELARIDWVAGPLAARAAILTARPNAAQLARAARLLDLAPVQAVLLADCGFALTVSSFRPSLLPRGDKVTLPVVRNAGIVRKAIVRLRGAGTVLLRFANGSPPLELSLEAGALAVYDPGQVVCTLDASNDEIEFIEMALIPRDKDQPLRVIWSGLNEWPLDPFHYDVAGMAAAPAFDGDSVSLRAVALG